VAIIPCGRGRPGGAPLTAIESATLVGMQNWVSANSSYFKKTNSSKYILMIAVTMFAVGLVAPEMIVIGVLLMFISLIIFFSRKVIPVEFPRPVVTRHPWAFFRGIPHLISFASASQMQLSLKAKCTSYHPHNPSSVPAAEKSSSGIRDYSNLSLDSLANLGSELRIYHQHLQGQAQMYFVASIITGNEAANLSTSIIPNFTQVQNSLSTSVSRINQAVSEQASTQEAFNQIEHIINTNRQASNFYDSQSKVDISPYLAWKNLLSEIGSEYSKMVLVSAAEGWERMIDSSKRASNYLTETVQHRLDEIEARIEADAQEAKAELNAKKKEIQMDIDAKGRELEHQLDSQINVVSAAKETVTKLNSMNIPRTISMEIPVATISGGGGNISGGSGFISPISTSISTKTVHLDNPAYDAGIQISELANSLARIEGSRLNSLQLLKNENHLKMELYEKDIQKRMKESKQEAERRMEAEKEVALKHARSVEHLHGELSDNPDKLDYNDFNRMMKSVWNRPTNVLSSHIDPISLDIVSVRQEFQRIENEEVEIENVLTHSPVSEFNSGDLEVHWIIGPDGQATENVTTTPLDIYVDNSITANKSQIAFLLAPEVAPMQVAAMSNEVLMKNIIHLQENGWMFPKLLKFTTGKTADFFRIGSEAHATPSQVMLSQQQIPHPQQMLKAR